MYRIKSRTPEHVTVPETCVYNMLRRGPTYSARGRAGSASTFSEGFAAIRNGRRLRVFQVLPGVVF